MIDYKTPEEIKIMQHGGSILADVLGKVMTAIKPGVTELAIDQLAEKLIREQGGEPGFKRVPGYHYTIVFRPMTWWCMGFRAVMYFNRVTSSALTAVCFIKDFIRT